MIQSNPEKILSEHINFFSNPWLSIDKDNTRIYEIESDFNFLEYKFKTLGATTDENDIVKAISVNYRKLLDTVFYEKIIKKYGAPSDILKRGKLIKSEHVEGLNGTEISSYTSTMINCSFKDAPDLIIWTKDTYRIEVSIEKANNNTNIRFVKNN